MLDVLIRNGSVVDGTGAPARGADVGIRDGRIVSLERSTEPARRTIDADGLTLIPGARDEFVGLSEVCGWHPGTSIEFIPDSFLRGFSDDGTCDSASCAIRWRSRCVTSCPRKI